MSRDKKEGWSHNTEIDNISFTMVENLKYLVKNLKYQYYIKNIIFIQDITLCSNTRI